jgi:rhamnosyltransferase
MKNFKSIYSAFILFNPEEDHHLESIKNIRKSGVKVVVFDNSDKKNVQDENYQRINNEFNGEVEYITNNKNIGLSAAFNRVAEHIINKDGAEAIILFDQDSTVTSEIFTKLINKYREVSSIYKVGVFSAYATRTNGGEPYGYKTTGECLPEFPGVIPVEFSPSSFSLIPLSTIISIGKFQEDYFIDHIDVEFCTRARNANLNVFIDTNLKFPHRIGDGDLTLFGKTIAPISSPFRHYYQVRNIILTGKRNNLPLHKSILSLCRRFIALALISLKHGGFRNRMKFYLKGLKDGISGNTGQMN